MARNVSRSYDPWKPNGRSNAEQQLVRLRGIGAFTYALRLHSDLHCPLFPPTSPFKLFPDAAKPPCRLFYPIKGAVPPPRGQSGCSQELLFLTSMPRLLSSAVLALPRHCRRTIPIQMRLSLQLIPLAHPNHSTGKNMRLPLLLVVAAAAAVTTALAREAAELECTPYTSQLDKAVDVEVCQGPWLDKDGLPILDTQYGALGMHCTGRFPWLSLS